ncbi:MAG: GntR family transcriptional regulator [Lentisphaerae bacterium]|nr:GntR family transcriptional regulator [Lentisphaerota bacterium]MBQ4329065.1 GntR family transcriptional regulator [Lentisphaeria bacterium]
MKTKTASLEQYLLSKINSGEFAPFSQIPSQFKLMQQFNCSRIIVQRVLKKLCNAGFLQASRGSGTFVRPGPYGSTLKEIIVISEYAANANYYPFSGILCNLNTPDIPVRWINQQFISRNSEHFFTPGQAVIWVLPAESQIMLMHLLRQRGIPQLLINRSYGDFDSICTDYWTSIAEGLEAVMQKGDKQIAVITPVPNEKSPYLTDRLMAFYEGCFKCGATIPAGWIVKHDEDGTGELDTRLEKLYKTSGFPRKIFLPHEKLLTGVILFASKHNLVLGKDYEILVFIQSNSMPPTAGLHMLHQPMELFRAGVEEFIRRTAAGDKSPFQRRLKTQLLCQV